VQVKEIMTPRTDMVTMPVDLSWEEALQQVIHSGHTRIPLHGRDRDEIVGILHTKDMLHALARGPQAAHRAIAELDRPTFSCRKANRLMACCRSFSAAEITWPL